MCKLCANRGCVPEPFEGLTLVPCPECSREPAYTALNGTEYVEAGDDLQDLLDLLVDGWESAGEDVVVWERRPDHGSRVAAVLQDHADGRPRVLTFGAGRAARC